MSIGNPPIPMNGRRSHGLEEDDWRHLAMAYDTWNEHVASCEDIDQDLLEFVKDVFDSCGLWDDIKNEPNITQYRTMFYNLC